MITIVELEKTATIILTPTPYDSPVWKYDLWTDSVASDLPFMDTSVDDYVRTPVMVSSLRVDSEDYELAATLADCVSTDGTYYVDGSTLYVHFEDSDPPFVFAFTSLGALTGYTDQGVKWYNGFPYLPKVKSAPGISEKVDPLDYSRMAFQSGTIELDNSDGAFDTDDSYFGNQVIVKAGEDSDAYVALTEVARYYIEDFSSNARSAQFSVKDRRELLSGKYPSALFDTTTFPDIDDATVGKVIPDAFGALLGVPGICVNGKGGNVAKVFKLAVLFSSLSAVYVYRNEQWEEVTPTATDAANGTITLSVSDAHDGGDYTHGLRKVKANGTFRLEMNPGDIIAKLNDLAADIAYNATNYDTVEWEAELYQLPDAGLYVDESREVYEWIERLQNGAPVGFMVMTRAGKITARLDNPNRTENARVIQPVDVTNILDVEIDRNATQYTSSAKIEYARDQESGDAPVVVNDDDEAEVVQNYKKAKVYEAEALTTDSSTAEDKAAVVMDDQSEVRPVYRGIKLFGREWVALRLYDTQEARLSILKISAPSSQGISKTTSTVRTLSALTDVAAYLGELVRCGGRQYRAQSDGWYPQDVTVPTGIVVAHDFLGLPEFPDDPAGTAYKSNWSSGVDGWEMSGGSLAYTGSILTCARTSQTYSNIIKTISGMKDKTIILEIKASAAIIVSIQVLSGTYKVIKFISATTNYQIVSVLNPWEVSDNILVIQSISDVGSIIYLKSVYVGTGAYLSQVPDNSGNGHHGTIAGAICSQGKLIGDGVSGSVTDIIACASSFSFAGFYKRTKASAIQHAVSIGGSSTVPRFALRYDASNNLTIARMISGAESLTTIGADPGTECPVMVAYDSVAAKVHVYVSALEVETIDGAIDATNNGIVRLGASAKDIADLFAGVEMRDFFFAPGVVWGAAEARYFADGLPIPASYTMANWLIANAGSTITTSEKVLGLVEWLKIYYNTNAKSPITDTVDPPPVMIGEFGELLTEAYAQGLLCTNAARSALVAAFEDLRAYTFDTPGVLDPDTWGDAVAVDTAVYSALILAYTEAAYDMYIAIYSGRTSNAIAAAEEWRYVQSVERPFAGTIRGQIVGRRVNLRNMTVEIDIRRREYSAVVAGALAGGSP